MSRIKTGMIVRRFKLPLVVRAAVVLICVLSGLVATALAQEQKPEDKRPKLLVASPPIVVPGVATKLLLRGVRIDDVTEIRATVADKQIEVKLGGKQKNNLGPNVDQKLAGDGQVELELTVPADTVAAPETKLRLVASTPAGTSEPYELTVLPADQFDNEQEPNDGFDLGAKKAAQSITAGKAVFGRIERGQDVDVYSIESAAGQKLTLEVAARVFGSPLDVALALFDQRGNLLASSDDTGASADARIEFTSSGGKLYVVVSDANDQGSPVHGYRLMVR